MPSIRVMLPLLMVVWCVGAVAAGMWPLLVYPALWLVVAAVFFVISKLLGGMGSAAEPSTSTN